MQDNRILKAIIIMVIVVSACMNSLHVNAVDGDVDSVIQQLEYIDTLQQMQDKRDVYKASGRWDVASAPASIVKNHTNARLNFEQYVSEMFSARLAAKKAYEALTDQQKSQIDQSLVDKLDDKLETVFKTPTLSVTPATDEYQFEAVAYGDTVCYEVSNYMVAGQIPQTFILVDTANKNTSWTPNGKFEYGKSNYNLTYCCDIQTGVEFTTDYKRVNLEDSSYYSKNASAHIRGILQNAYPFITIEQMKASLKKGGLDSDFVDSLNKSDIISAVQMAIWTYANSDVLKNYLPGYFASFDVERNAGGYFDPLHDYSNEMWEWFPSVGGRTYDPNAEYRVNTLYYYLCHVEPVEAKEIVISNLKLTRAQLINERDDLYNVGMYVHLNEASDEKDNLIITAKSYHNNDDGSKTVTDVTRMNVNENTKYQLTINAEYGDTISVVVEGKQHVSKGVYLYEPKGGRDISQVLVGVSEGETNVKVEEEFVFQTDIEKGIRVYKTSLDNGWPLSDITFNVYKVNKETDQILSDVPTITEIQQFVKDENKVGSLITDKTGYGCLGLDDGTYIVVEQDNDKIKEPIKPFYITVPIPVEKTDENGQVEIVYETIVSVYPKNETKPEDEEPPITPPTPEGVKGNFEILKHDINDSSKVLSGAEFKVYKLADEEDDFEILNYNEIEYAVVPVIYEEKELVLKTDDNGKAVSPKLPCGTYFLVETNSPSGYNLLDSPVYVYVQSDKVSHDKLVAIGNTPGSILPETGGIGTHCFIITGSILIFISVFIYIKERFDIKKHI